MRDLGTQETQSGSQMCATGHLPPFPSTWAQVLTQGPGDVVWPWASLHGAEN